MARPLAATLVLGGVALALGAGVGLWLLAPAAPTAVPPADRSSGRGSPRPGEGAGDEPGDDVPRPAATGIAPRGAPRPEEVGDEDTPDDEGDLVGGVATYEEILAAATAGKWLEVESLLRRGGSTDPRVTDLLLKHLADPRWRNFAAGLFEFVKDPGAARKLLAITGGDAPEATRMAALLAFAGVGGPELTEEALRILRESPDGSPMAAAAALALGREGSAASAAVLMDLLREGGRAGSRAALVDALGRIRAPEALDAMARMLHEEGLDGSLRGALIEAMARTRDPALAADLVRFAHATGDADLRREAWKALGMVGGEVAVQELLSVFAGGDPADRLAAAVALQGVKDPGAAGPVAKILQSSTDPTLRGYLVSALGAMGGTAAVGALGDVVRDGGEAMGLRVAAVRALGEIGDRSGAGPILDAYEGSGADDAALRRTAIEALRKIGDTSALPRLETFLRNAREGTAEMFLLQTTIQQMERDRAAQKDGGPAPTPPAFDGAPITPRGAAGELQQRADLPGR